MVDKHVQMGRYFSGILTVGGVILLTNEIFPDILQNTYKFYVNMASAVLVSIGLFGLTNFLKCSNCGLKLMVYSMRNNSSTDWLSWVLEAKECPSCKHQFNQSKDSQS